MTDKTTLQFICDHLRDDVRRLALAHHGRTDIDLAFALEQIEGWQKAEQKLPTWASTEGMVFPPKLNMEQCSSEQTARYKADVAKRCMAGVDGATRLVDLTGGYGVDFAYMCRAFSAGVYVERNEKLCRVAEHNFKLLGLSHSEVVCGDGIDYFRTLSDFSEARPFTLIYLDPARRDVQGKKVYGPADCEPNVVALRDELLSKADVLMLKLSPMFDWHAAVADLVPEGYGAEVHIVSVDNECKELLLLISRKVAPLRVICVNDDTVFEYSPGLSEIENTDSGFVNYATSLEGMLYVPNASIMKSGAFDLVGWRFRLAKIAPDSHLFVSHQSVDQFPGRRFRITDWSTMNRRDLSRMLCGIECANITTRNFPLSADALRKRLKLRDGGSVYLFATTWKDKHVVLLCEKVTDRI